MSWLRGGTVALYLGLTVLALTVSGPSVAQADDPAAQAWIADRDGDGDGAVSRSEYDGTPLGFARRDSDGDGRISLDDVLWFEGRRREVLTAVRRGRQEPARKFAEADRDGDGVIARAEFPADEALFQRFDRDADGQIRLEEGLEFAIEEELGKLFAAHDHDLSGTLDEVELPEQVRPIMDYADADDDGQLSGPEAQVFLRRAWIDAPAGRATTTAASRGEGVPGVFGVLDATFDQADADEDGVLRGDELAVTPALLESLDVDGDGGVSRGELTLRIREARAVGQRGQQLKARLEQAGVEDVALLALGAEVRALFEAGRLDEVERVLDALELRLAE